MNYCQYNDKTNYCNLSKQNIVMYVLTFFMVFVHTHAQREGIVPHEGHYHPDQDFGVPATKKKEKTKIKPKF